MRVFLGFILLTVVKAFCPIVHKPQLSTTTKPTSTQLQASMDRRHVLVTLATLVLAPQHVEATPLAVHNRKGVSASSTWFFDEKIDQVHEEAQMPTGDKLDLNSAIVVRGNTVYEGMYGWVVLSPSLSLIFCHALFFVASIHTD